MNTPDEPQDLTLALFDGGLRMGHVVLSDHGPIIWPVTHGGGVFKNKSVLRTIRTPLSAFTDANPRLDLTDIRYVALVFDQTRSADLRIDDIVFTD